jgi:N,N'-diacetyllegionaminate synthase
MKSFRQTCLGDSIDPEASCLIIAEVAQSHDGSLGQAHAFIDAIAQTGADAVKFQTHIADAESTYDEPWRVRFGVQDRTRFEYWKRMEFSQEEWSGLKRHAEEHGLLFLSSPFSSQAVDLLENIGMRVWKIASGEVANSPLLEKVCKTGNPVILSSGMSGWEELGEAVATVRNFGNPLAVLQCTSAYPCPPEKTGLNLIGEIKTRYGCPSGLSDHSGKIYAGLAAAALGSEVVETHVCLSREMFGPDVSVSITTSELRQLVEGVRSIEIMNAHPVDKDRAGEELADLRKIFTKSIHVAETLAAGTVLEARHLELKKPGNGIPPSDLPIIIGARLRHDVSAGDLLFLEHVHLKTNVQSQCQ